MEKPPISSGTIDYYMLLSVSAGLSINKDEEESTPTGKMMMMTCKAEIEAKQVRKDSRCHVSIQYQDFSPNIYASSFKILYKHIDSQSLTDLISVF